MAGKIRFIWQDRTPPPEGGTLDIVTDPLASGPSSKWTGDLLDYGSVYLELYRLAKEKSTRFITDPDFGATGLGGTPITPAAEPTVFSFWLQVLRDRLLVKGLFEREKPSTVELSQGAVDYKRVAGGGFDPGLFEHTAGGICRDMGIEVTGAGEKSPAGETGVSLAGMLASASLDLIKGTLKKQKAGGRLLLLGPYTLERLGEDFIDLARGEGYDLVVGSADLNNDFTSLYGLCAGEVGPISRVLDYRRILKAHEMMPKKKWDDFFPAEGADYGEIARSVIRSFLLRHAWPEAYSMRLAEAFFNKHRPDALIVLYDHGHREAGLVGLARKHGTRTITLQHGNFLPGQPAYLPVRSDVFACWSEHYGGMMEDMGVEHGRAAVTGYPLYDRPLSVRPATRPSPGLPIKVLVATQGAILSVEPLLAYTPTPRIISALAGEAASLGDFLITFRLHPNEQLPDRALSLAREHGIALTRGEPLTRQLGEADVVVVQTSTFGMDALLQNTPLVVLGWPGVERSTYDIYSNVAEISEGAGDFADTVKRAIEKHPAKRAAMEDFFKRHLTGPGSSERLLELCRQGHA